MHNVDLVGIEVIFVVVCLTKDGFNNEWHLLNIFIHHHQMQ